MCRRIKGRSRRLGDVGAFATVGWFVERRCFVLECFIVARAGVGEDGGRAADGRGVTGERLALRDRACMKREG
jgi:hypothetical protein